jgi:hypothetical protein
VDKNALPIEGPINSFAKEHSDISVEVLLCGAEVMPAMLEIIESAKHEVRKITAKLSYVVALL